MVENNMHKKIDTHNLNIPIDDVECWDRYPKYRWVYDLSRLLDAQNIQWSPFKRDNFADMVPNMDFESVSSIMYNTGTIFINAPIGANIITEVYIAKGDIKLIRHIDKSTAEEIQDFTGGLELRINAFVSIHFQKFTGVISVESIGNDIMAIRLRPNRDISADQNLVRLAKKIYKKTDLTLPGLTDQVIHESVAS